MLIRYVIYFIVGLALTCVGGDRLVDAAVAISKKIGIPQIVVGATIVSLGTTLPEILVSTTAVFSGSAAISAGNAFGSIICNTALIAGLAQIIRPTKDVEQKSLRWRAVFFTVIIAALFLYGMAFRQFDLPIGIALLLGFVLYAILSIKRADLEEDSEDDDADGENISVLNQLIILAISAAFLYVGANLMVDNGTEIATLLGVPERVIAVTFIALGTSLPELVTCVVSLLKGYGNVSFGNIIGANMLNMLLVIGIPATFAGIPLESSTLFIDIPLAFLVMAILIAPILIRGRSSRVQGVLLVGIYVVYCITTFV